jgi:CubicO group peptidase (beta-lactamase class C family)
MSRKKHLKKLMLPVLVLFSLLFYTHTVFCQIAEVSSTSFEEVKETILKAVNSGKVPSISVAVAKNGKIIWEEAFGWADREKLIKATPHTMYSMASISKPIATTGLMKLVERGLVDLEKSVDTYISPAKLTAYEGDASNAHVHHILNHTSGLPTHYTCFYLDEPGRQPPPAPESIRRYGILVHPPGEVYQYANFGFALADFIISKISGLSFADFMKTEVFLPLGMTHASINVGPGLEKFAAERYNTDGKPVPFYISDHPGASQVYCSAHDLIRFGLFHLKNPLPEQTKILKDETIDLMQNDSDPNPDNNRYGLGWFLREDEYGYSTVFHTGSMRGVNNILKMVPSEKIAVVVLINTTSPLRNKLPNDIIGVLLPDYGEEWKKVRDKPSERRRLFKPVPELMGLWEGHITTYEEVIPLTMDFQLDGDIHVKIKGQLETLLNNPRYRNEMLTGTCSGTIPSGDARRFPHDISFRMKLKEDMLSGYISTRFRTERSYGTFSSYVKLTRKK